MAREVAVVPHTHWDREWYAPFQTFRMRLVELLDSLLPAMESDASYAYFLLDGQMAAVDDYLAVRPEAEGRLRRLAAAGRLSLGPWYVLPDEFCVSGETLVRNLQLGLERASTLGEPMAVGYLPDTFGHIAQMPQLLRQAGFEHAVVWRGVPRAVDRTAFRWSAPDGSTVRAEYLPLGYGNGAAVPDDAKRLLGRLHAHEAELGPLLPSDAALLWMNGTDHQLPQPWLGRVVAEANDLQERYRLTVVSLPAYLATAPADGLPAWSGELRSGARANLLPGVASNRVDVKQAAARAERALERRAEPLSALFLPPDRWPERLLRMAWLEVLRNAAHDSVCACSADEVVESVLGRYREARQVGEGLADRALSALGASLSVAGPVVVNPSARNRGGLVELTVPGTPPAGSQAVFVRQGDVTLHTVAGAEVGALIGQVTNRALSEGGVLSGIDVLEGDDGLDIVLRTGAPGAVEPTAASDLSDAFARAGAGRDRPVRVRVERSPYCRVLMPVDDVPGFGWQSLLLRSDGPLGPLASNTASTVEPVRVDGNALTNGLLRVEVDPVDGTLGLSIGEDGPLITGLDRLVDGGDAGDTYNYSPPATDRRVDRPVAVNVEAAESGPLRAALDVTRTFLWPAALDGDVRAGEHRVDVSTRVELCAGEPFVRITTTFDNRCRDHRLRAWFPLPRRATTSHAESAFTVVERGLEAEGGAHERGLATFPSRRFVSAGGLTLAHEGLLEYEVVDGGRALALTLLRCVGVLSGTDLAYRSHPAGPPLPVEGAQMQGPQAFRYAVAPGPERPVRAGGPGPERPVRAGSPGPGGAGLDPYALADDAFLPLEVTWGSGTGPRSPAGSALSVHGAEVSAVRRVGMLLEVRVFNPTDRDATVTLTDRSGWLVDLRHRPLAPFDGSFALRPHGIATAMCG